MPKGWKVTVSIVNSQLAVTLTTTHKVKDIHDMRERVEIIVRFCVDALGFLLACGYDIEITQMIALDPIVHNVFGVNVLGVTQAKTEDISVRFKNILEAPPYKQQALRRALVDFREAIRSYEDTPFFCFRAIEDLRQCFVSGKDNNVKKTWEKMATELKISNRTINYVRNKLSPIAMSIRHGQSTQIKRKVRVRMLRITWNLIDRFVSADISGLKPPLNPNAPTSDMSVS